jgi:hypothetical protein
MGSFYGNLTVLDTDVDAVAAVAPRPAFLAQVGPDVVVFAAVDEPVVTTGDACSALLGRIAVGVSVFDDDLLVLSVHHAGATACSGSIPDPEEVFGEPDPSMPPVLSPSDAVALVNAVGRGDPDVLAAVLSGEDLFASDTHAKLVAALGLPACAVGFGHRYLATDPGGFAGPPLIALV